MPYKLTLPTPLLPQLKQQNTYLCMQEKGHPDLKSATKSLSDTRQSSKCIQDFLFLNIY